MQALRTSRSTSRSNDGAGPSGRPAVCCVRIVQESLSNVAKYARPAHTAVTVGHDGTELVVEITDDGANRRWHRRGSGLRGMRERAEQFGGNLEAGPTPDGGWRVRATFPLQHVPA